MINEYLTKEQNEKINREMNMTAKQILEQDEKDLKDLEDLEDMDEDDEDINEDME